MTRTRNTERVSPAFFLLQSIIIRNMAAAKIPTSDIAGTLGVDRSYVIRLAQDGVVLAPSNAREQLLLNLATDDAHRQRIQNLGLKGLTSGLSLEITLAGGERPKLGTKEERAAARAQRAVQNPALALDAPQPEPTKPKRAKKEAAPAPAPEPAPAKAKRAKKEAAPAPAPEPAKAVKVAKVKAGPKKPLKEGGGRRAARNPAPPVATEAPTADDILGNL